MGGRCIEFFWAGDEDFCFWRWQGEFVAEWDAGLKSGVYIDG